MNKDTPEHTDIKLKPGSRARASRTIDVPDRTQTALAEAKRLLRELFGRCARNEPSFQIIENSGTFIVSAKTPKAFMDANPGTREFLLHASGTSLPEAAEELKAKVGAELLKRTRAARPKKAASGADKRRAA